MQSSTPESAWLDEGVARQLVEPRHARLRHATTSAIRKYPFPALVALVLIVMGAAVGLAGVIATDPNVVDPFIRLQGPSWDHIMGTDNLGRDVFARVLHGGRTSLGISVAAVGLATAVYTLIGVLSGYLGGWFDVIVQRLVDILMSFPGLIIVISLATFMGPGVTMLIFAIGIVLLGGGVRVARGATLQVAAQPYVEAAQAMGAWTPRIVVRHLLPNVMPPVMVIATAQLGIAILIEAGASFLGYGIQPPNSSWGFMLGAEARVHMEEQVWLSVWPGLAIFLAVFSFNILGDTLRDVFDPRLRGAGGGQN